MSDRTVRRWALALLSGYALCAAVILLAPVSYGEVVVAIGEMLRRATGATWFGLGWIEFAGNVMLFVPLGLLLTLLGRRPWWGAVVAVGCSLGVELAQSVLPGRVVSARDVLANALGAVLGAGIAWVGVTRRRAPPRATRRAR